MNVTRTRRVIFTLELTEDETRDFARETLTLDAGTYPTLVNVAITLSEVVYSQTGGDLFASTQEDDDESGPF